MGRKLTATNMGGTKRLRFCACLSVFLIVRDLAAQEVVPHRLPDSGGTPLLTHGPILGRPGAHHMGIWARTSRPATFRVRYEAANHLEAVSQPVTTRLETDCTGWVLLKDLQADTLYRYAIVGPNPAKGQTLNGSFRTLPDADDFRDADRNPNGLFNFSFEFACGNQQRRQRTEKQRVPTFVTIIENHGQQLHFSIQNGDWLYEDFRKHSLREWREAVGIDESETPPLLRAAPMLVGVWENYKMYLWRSDELSAFHRRIPSFFIYDDHEIVDDSAGAGTIGARPRRALFRDIGVRGWYDYTGWSNPVQATQDAHFGVGRFEAGSDVLTDDAADFDSLDLAQISNLHVHWGTENASEVPKTFDTEPGSEPNAGVYELVEILDSKRLKVRPPARHTGDASFSIGRLSYYKQRISNCEFFFLDTRGHRDIPDNKNPKKAGVSILGAKQVAWLKQQTATSDADFFFLISSVNFMVPHLVDWGETGYVGYDDSWCHFWLEREEIIGFLESLDKKVFLLTGDLHNSFVVKVSENIWEFAAGPRSSGNARYTSEGGRPPNGAFDSYGRRCFIRWSTWFETSPTRRQYPRKVYCIASVNNVFRNLTEDGGNRWQAYNHPQVVFKYYDGLSGELLYAESVLLD